MPAGKTDGRRQRGDSTRRAIVEATIDVLATDGFDGLTLREVAARAGVSPAAATYHFGTVDALVAAVLQELDERATRRLADLTERSRAGELSLLDACTTYLADLLGPGRSLALTQLEIRLRAARAPGAHPQVPPVHHDRQVIDLITTYTGDRRQAHELFLAVFGFATLGVLAPAPPGTDAVRNYMAGLLARHGLLDTDAPTGGAP